MVPTKEVDIKFETIEALTIQSLGPVVPTNVETKFETIEVDNTICVAQWS